MSTLVAAGGPPTDAGSSQQVIQRYCKNGDPEAFAVFYRSQSRRLWRFLVARGCDQEAAYDICSEAFLRFSQTVCKDPASPEAFLFRIALNLYIDQLRRQRIAPVSYAAEEDLPEIAAADDPELHLHNRQVRELVGTLENTEQNLLLMRYWLGMSHKEVALSLELPEGTVRRRCSEALHKLAGKLAAAADPDAMRP
ncbi:MAG: sigma-70 family RNA polymerase sigma factor [Methylococcaceae bacterium]|nr:MAG: sigma-70 family RNA polymerase sigma factor [Methylococcaceae bacterium]